MSEPEQPRRGPVADGMEVRPGSAPEGSADRRRRREQDGDSGSGRDDRGLDLRRHATEADAAAAPSGVDVSQVFRAPYLRHEPRVRSAGVVRVETVDVGKQYERVGVDEMSHK